MIRDVADDVDVDVDGQPGSLAIPARGVVLLIGASGSGKSTFAQQHFAPTEILSSDAFRALVSDDERDQTATAAAFDLLHRTLAHRLHRGRLTVVDATNATPGDRRSLLRLAAIARRAAAAIVLDEAEATCLARNARRAGRTVAEDVVKRQWLAVRRSVADRDGLLAEGFAIVHVLDGAAPIDAVRLVRDDAIRQPPPAPAPGRRPADVGRPQSTLSGRTGARRGRRA